MMNLFDIVPGSFFNYLGSGSNNRIYSDCLQVIYDEYEREITYRIPRSRIRDALAIYLLENNVELQEEGIADSKNYNDVANSVIRKFCDKNVQWLEEDIDDATYEKHIIMTEQGILLAEFLEQLKKPEKEEFSSYIFNIYNSLKNREQWQQDPYVDVLKNVYRNAKQLSKALKKLATFIRKIIERMVNEETLESLTENIIEYCEGSFIKEYARLTKQQNIHIYRTYIRSRMDEMQEDSEIYELLVIGCAVDEELEETQAEQMVQDMIQNTKRFLSDDYDRIMQDIRHKINLYLQIAVGRARFIRNREADVRGSVEQTLRYMVEEMQELNMKDDMPEEMNALFLLEKNEFLDLGSLRYPRRQQAIRKITVTELEIMTEEDMEREREAQIREAYNPYSRELMKTYLEQHMTDRDRISSDDLPLCSKRDLLTGLSAVAYGEENGYEVDVLDGYFETNHMIMRSFVIKRKKDE